MSFRKFHGMEGDIHWRRHFVLQVNYLSLFTDCNRTYTNHRACAVSGRCEISEESME